MLHSSPIANLVDPSWWKSDDGNCGFKISNVTNLDSLINEYNNSNNWSYVGRNPPYRLLDFNGYNHNSKKNIINFVDPDEAFQEAGNISYGITYSDYSNNNISMSDFSPIFNGQTISFKDCYAGLLLSNNYKKYIFINSSKTNLKVDDISVTTASLDVGKYNIYPFFTRYIFSGEAIGNNNVLFTMPLTPLVINIKKGLLDVSIIIDSFSASSFGGKLTFYYNVFFRNNSTQTAYFNDLYVTITGGNNGDETNILEQQLESFSILPGYDDLKRYTSTKSSIGYNRYKIVIRSDNYNITAEKYT